MNTSSLQGYKRTIYVAIIVIAFGVLFSTTMSDSLGGIGTVFIAIGGLLFIVGMNNKRTEDQNKNI
jgi:hypothetical protein